MGNDRFYAMKHGGPIIIEIIGASTREFVTIDQNLSEFGCAAAMELLG